MQPVTKPLSLTPITQTLSQLELGYSPSARTRLISALLDENPGIALGHLEALTCELAPLDLAVFIYAALQGTHLADKKRTLSCCLLTLCTKLVQLTTCSNEDWTKLCALLMQQPPFASLAEFLKGAHFDEPDAADETFIYTTLSQLAKAYNEPNALSELALTRTLLDETIPSWIDLPRGADYTVISLVFTYSLCRKTQAEQWDLETLSCQNDVQEFILQAIAKSRYSEAALRFLERFKNVVDTDSWTLATRLSCQSLEYVASILLNNNETPVDPALCLAILDNSNNATELKLSILVQIFRTMQECDIALLSQILSKLTTPQILRSSHIITLYQNSMHIKWTTSCIAFTYETTDLVSRYEQAAVSWLEIFDRITVILHGKNASFCRAQFDIIATKFIEASIQNLILFATENKASLKEISPGRVRGRIKTAIVIKEAAIRLLFTIYRRILDSTTKNKLYEKLKEVLPTIDVTSDKREFKVEELYGVEGYRMLGFSHGSVETTFVIAPDINRQSE